MQEEMRQAWYRGWKSLIPLRPNDKRPAIPWDEYKTRAPNPDEYSKMILAGKFNTGYGIVTGEVNGITVLDVDMPEGQERLEAQGFYLTNYLTPTVVTPGGMHLYFKYTPELHTGARVIGPGVDVRNDKGYVVGPGSQVAGNVYKWKEHPDDVELDEVPENLINLIRNYRPSTLSTAPYLNEPVKEGKRNIAMAGLAGALIGRQVPPMITVETMLYINDRFFDPPLPDDEVRAVWESIEQRRKEDDIIA